MADEREDLQARANKLRGLDEKGKAQMEKLREELAPQLSNVQEVTSSRRGETPKVEQDESSGSVKHRHIKDHLQEDLVARPPGGQTQDVSAATKAPPEKSASDVAKQSDLQELASRIRKNGVSGKQTANEPSPPSPTHQRPKKGRGRG